MGAASNELHRPSTGSRAFAALVCLAAWVVFALLLVELARRPFPWQFSRAWAPSLGLEFALRVDGLSALMLLLITGVGACVFTYAAGYLAHDPRRTRILAQLSLFLVAMVGCVSADNVLLLFLCWEATSLLSFLLVGTNYQDEDARKSAQQALFITGVGGLYLLAGLLLLAQLGGSHSLAVLLARGPELVSEPLFPCAFAALVIGCMTKSAQFPFHFWLPNAMAAPTPVSAYLHSATMVKLGVYLLARLHVGFGAWPGWALTLVPIGALTATWAMVLALRERDLKRILARSTVGALGTLFMLIGLPGEGAALATVAFLLAHALYKAPLFFVAGNVDHAVGTRIIDRLGGLRHALPFSAAAALLAGVSMAGVPLSFGYLAKDAIKAAKSGSDTLPWLLTVAQSNRVVAALSVAVAAVAAVRVFWKHPGVNEHCDAREGGAAMVLPPLALACAGIVFGLFPGLIEPLLVQAAGAMLPGGAGAQLTLGQGGSEVLAAATLALALGALAYFAWDPLHRLLERRLFDDRFALAGLYRAGLDGLPRLAAFCTRAVQHGRLPEYVALILALAIAPIAAAVWCADGVDLGPLPAPELAHAGAAALIAAGALSACFVTSRLLLLLASGLVGYGSAVLFLFSGAPDLAFTQFVVESVFVVVVASSLLAMRRVTHLRSVVEPRVRPLAALLSLAFGAAIAALVLWVAAQPFDAATSEYFKSAALPQAHGRNVVNVVIVDFRGLDTLGESAVVLFSFLAALPLLQALRGARGRNAA